MEQHQSIRTGQLQPDQAGSAVMAIGDMFGYGDGVSCGIVSSIDYKETFFDRDCDIIATDIL